MNTLKTQTNAMVNMSPSPMFLRRMVPTSATASVISFYDRLSSSVASIKTTITHTKFFSHPFKRHCLPHYIYKDSVSPVHFLFLPRSPSAVFLAVVAVVINSFNRSIVSVLTDMSNVGIPHIFKEDFKRIPETFYPSTPVIFISWVMYVFTTLLHQCKDIVKSRATQFMGRVRSACQFFVQTTARSRMTLIQVLSIHNTLFSTVTLTQPTQLLLSLPQH